MKTVRSHAIFFCVSLFFIGCMRDPRSFIDSQGSKTLIEFSLSAREKYLNGVSRLPKSDWPEGWSNEVHSIRMNDESVMIELTKGERYSRGVLIMWTNTDPSYIGSGFGVSRVQDKIYTYCEKVRVWKDPAALERLLKEKELEKADTLRDI